MSLYAFLRGYNEMGDSLTRERINKTRASMLEDELKTQRDDKAAMTEATGAASAALRAAQEERARQPAPADVGPISAAQGVMPLPQPDTQAPTLANGGVMPLGVTAGAQEPASPPMPEPPAQRVTVTGKKPEADVNFDIYFKTARDALIKKGRGDLAAKIDAQWTDALRNEMLREESKYERVVAPKKRQLSEAQIDDQLSAITTNRVGIALKALDNPVSRALGADMLNKLNGELGIWKTNQAAAGLSVDRASKRIVIVDAQGQPIMGDGNQPLSFSGEEFARLTGRQSDIKIEKLAAGERVVGVNTRTGTAQTLVEGEPKPETKAEERQRVKMGADALAQSFGAKLDPLNRMIDTESIKDKPAYEKALAELERRVQAGEPPLRVAQELGDQYRRKAAVSDPKKAAAAQPSQDYSRLWR